MTTPPDDPADTARTSAVAEEEEAARFDANPNNL